MTGAGCSVHPEPGGHSELLATNGELIHDYMDRQEPQLPLQWPTQVAQHPCWEHCSPVQDGIADRCASSALIGPLRGDEAGGRV